MKNAFLLVLGLMVWSQVGAAETMPQIGKQICGNEGPFGVGHMLKHVPTYAEAINKPAPVLVSPQELDTPARRELKVPVVVDYAPRPPVIAAFDPFAVAIAASGADLQNIVRGVRGKAKREQVAQAVQTIKDEPGKPSDRLLRAVRRTVRQEIRSPAPQDTVGSDLATFQASVVSARGQGEGEPHNPKFRERSNLVTVSSSQEFAK